MVLSIGMIVKNEEKYLEQCLTGLQPILDELDSELIIADTGSTDRTVEIARKFTDNVYHFEWINDFSAARNSTLEKAKGEWYMFIDADEIASDCTEIIKFFKSGEYQKFRSLTYIVRNLREVENKNDYSDFRAVRAVKREADTKFINPVHEILYPYYDPVKYLDFVVDHYGYIYHGEDGITELAREKSRRNLELLFDELNNNEITETRFSIYDQIADSYEIIDDLDNTLKYLDIGLEKTNHRSINIVGYYTHKIAVLSKLDKIDEIIETSDEYFDIGKNPFHTKDLASDCYVRAMRGYAFYNRREYSKAISEFVKFFDLYRRYTKGKLNTDDLVLDVWRTTESIVKASYDIFFRCCYQEKRFDLANQYTKAIPLEKYFDNHDFMENHLNIRVEMMEELGYNDLDMLYRQIDEFGKDHLLSQVRQKVFKTKSENREMILKKLSTLGEIPAELVEIYKGYFDGAPNFELIKAFLEKHGSENSEDMLYILLENQKDIAPFLLTEDFFADRAVQILIIFFPHGIELYKNYNIDNIQDGLERATSLYGYVMLRVMERGLDIAGLFETYGALGMKWYNKFSDSASVPGDIRAALLVNNVVSAKNVGNYTQFMDSIRKLKSIVPDLIPLADAYKNENKDAFKTKRVNPEFEKLAVQVKSNIRELIASGNIGDARKLLKEFEEISPNDPDIEVIKDEINNSLQ